ncbi:MAG TPA: hypothetical protein DCF63_16245, partial [Planctomycetaceae bacterium]|nr:hypothetical protein [Planctomycetaceae bacterium]
KKLSYNVSFHIQPQLPADYFCQRRRKSDLMSQPTLLRDPFQVRDTFQGPDGPIGFYSLKKLQEKGFPKIATLPYSIRILLEAVLRNCDGYVVTQDDVKNLAGWQAAKPAELEIPFMPARVVLQDFT